MFCVRDHIRELWSAKASSGLLRSPLRRGMSSDRQVHDASALMRRHHKHVDFFTVPTIVLASNFFMEVWLSPALGFDVPKGPGHSIRNR